MLSVAKKQSLANYCLWLTIKSEAVAIRADGSGFPHNGIATLADLIVVGQRGDFRGCLRAVLGRVLHGHIKRSGTERPARFYFRRNLVNGNRGSGDCGNRLGSLAFEVRSLVGVDEVALGSSVHNGSECGSCFLSLFLVAGFNGD